MLGHWRAAAMRLALSLYWPVATYIGGCVKTRLNGWF